MWPVNFLDLKHIDELLICGICYEYMDTSVMTLCSHNYCSLCIRKYLHYKTECPICSEEAFEKDLRKNKVLDDIIARYLNVKNKLEGECYKKVTRIEKLETEKFQKNLENKTVDENERFYEKSSSPESSNFQQNITPLQKNHQQHVSSPSTSAESRIPLMFTTPKKTKSFQNKAHCEMVPCPVCKVDVPQNNINRHLDDCLRRASITNEKPKKIKTKREPLPKLVFNLMKESVLRKKLKEFGLSSQGDRKVLEGRLRKYITLYNAECDKINPRAISELIKQCEDEENYERKTQSSLNVNKLHVNRKTEHNVAEEQRKQYLTTNKDSFKQLIAKIKSNTKLKKTPVKCDMSHYDVSDKDFIIENDSPVKDSDDDFLSICPNNFHIEDSDSNGSYPLQTYSSDNPMNFLALELNASSSEDTDQCISISNHKNSDHFCITDIPSSNSILKTENVKIDELSLTNASETETLLDNSSNNMKNVLPMEECNILENTINIDVKELALEMNECKSKNKKIKLFAKDNKTKEVMEFGENDDTTCLNIKDEWQKKTKNVTNSILEDQDMIKDDINNQLDYEILKHRDLQYIKEKSDNLKSEKENVKLLDENIVVPLFRKRERDTMLNDEEQIPDQLTHRRKSLRLNQAKRFNNVSFDESTLQNEAKSLNENEESHGTYMKNKNHSTRESVRLKNKISNMKNNDIT